MEIRVDFDALMDFGGVYRTLSESLDRRAVTHLHFEAERIQQVVSLYDLDVVSPSGGNLVIVRDDAVARSQRIADYLMSCSTDLFRHAGAVNQVDTGFDWSGLVWTVGDLFKESFQTVTDSVDVLEPFVKRFPELFPTFRLWGEIFEGVAPFVDVVSFPLDIIDYSGALETIRDNPWLGWFEGIEAGLGITTGLILGAKVVFGAGAVATLLPAVPYLLAGGLAITVGVTAFKFADWAFGDAAYWMGGVMYDTWSVTTDFVGDAASAVADFGADVVDGAQNLWDDTVEFGADAWNFVFGDDGVIDQAWERAVDAINQIEDYLHESWNREFVPAASTVIWQVRDWVELDGEPPSGDLEAREPGKRFPTRVSGQEGGPSPFSVEGSSPTARGRSAIIRSLQDTKTKGQILDDEFQVISHSNGTYTVVLPGVIDLKKPTAGLSEYNRSVRDVDWAAARSAASSSVDDNRYAAMVRDYIREQVPPGSKIAIVGHSFGADTALDLTADKTFNGEDYEITHVVAAGYYSDPQLGDIPSGTEVLVLKNKLDAAIALERQIHASDGHASTANKEEVIVDNFFGGLGGLGHDQQNYIDRVLRTDNDRHEEFFASWSDAGYGADGKVTAVDVSVHESDAT